MTCSLASQLTEIDLLMALDGTAEPEVMKHLDQCSDCRDRATRLLQMQIRVAQRLFRAACPSSIELGDYHLGLLAAPQAEAVERHLVVCPWCSDEQAVLAEFLPDPFLAPKLNLLAPVKKTVRVLVARLSDAWSSGGPLGHPGLAPAFAGLRGETEGPLLYEADGVQVMADVLDDAAHPGRKAILGLLTGIVPVGSFQAYLWQAASYCHTAPVTGLGNFTLDNLLPGAYSLVLSGPDLEIHLDDLPVTAR